MKYATLGNTGLQVSRLCFGTMTFGDGRGMFKAVGAVGQAAADELIKISIESGINFFDTADIYTEGESEKSRDIGYHRRETARPARGQSWGGRHHAH